MCHFGEVTAVRTRAFSLRLELNFLSSSIVPPRCVLAAPLSRSWNKKNKLDKLYKHKLNSNHPLQIYRSQMNQNCLSKFHQTAKVTKNLVIKHFYIFLNKSLANQNGNFFKSKAYCYIVTRSADCRGIIHRSCNTTRTGFEWFFKLNVTKTDGFTDERPAELTLADK